MIITQNTTWAAGSTHTLSETVQIAAGATLTIESGAVVVGNGHTIQTFGALSVTGTADDPVDFNNVRFSFGDSASNPGRIEILSAVLNGGAFLPTPNSGAGYGSFTVSYSTFNETDYSDISNPTSESYFLANIFYKSGGISVDMAPSVPFSIVGNIFVEWTGSTSLNNSAITLRETHDRPLYVFENSFYGAGTAVELTKSGSYIHTKDNYAHLDDDLTLEKVVIDTADNPEIGEYAFLLGRISPFGVTVTLNDALRYSDDCISGTSNREDIFSGAGNDTVFAGEGDDYVRGQAGHDILYGGAGFDNISGNTGRDTVYGGEGGDWVVGGKDSDQLHGEVGADVVYGNLGDDSVNGGDGNDWVRGGQGDDVLQAGAGNDWVSGDLGADTIYGGTGADVFHTWGAAGLDLVKDFSRADGDRVLLDVGTLYSLVQTGSDLIINMTGGGQMVLENTMLNSLSGDWIYFG